MSTVSKNFDALEVEYEEDGVWTRIYLRSIDKDTGEDVLISLGIEETLSLNFFLEDCLRKWVDRNG